MEIRVSLDGVEDLVGVVLQHGSSADHDGGESNSTSNGNGSEDHDEFLSKGVMGLIMIYVISATYTQRTCKMQNMIVPVKTAPRTGSYQLSNIPCIVPISMKSSEVAIAM